MHYMDRKIWRDAYALRPTYRLIGNTMKKIILATLLAGIAATGAMAQPTPSPYVNHIISVHSGNLTAESLQSQLQALANKHKREVTNKIQDFVRYSTGDLINKPLMGGGDHDYVDHGIQKPTQPGEVVIFDES